MVGFNWWETIILAASAGAVVTLVGWVSGPPEKGKSSHRSHPHQHPAHHRGGRGGPDNPMTLQDLITQAEIAKRQGRFEEAKAIYQKLKEVLSSTPQLGNQHPYYALTVFAEALVYREQGDMDTAATMMTEARDILNLPQNRDSQSATQIDICATLADTLIDLNRYEEAEEPLTEAITITERALEETESSEDEHEKLLKQRTILEAHWTELQFKQKKFAEAEERASKAATDLEKIYGGTEEMIVVKHLIRLCGILYKVGKEEESDRLERRLIQEKEKEEGPNTPAIAQFLFHFARSYIEVERYDRAEAQLKRAKDIYERDPYTFQDDLTKCEEELAKIEQVRRP